MVAGVIRKWFIAAKKEVLSHRIIYTLLLLILFIASFVRIYRTEELMGFYYDQGRDALVIWRLWHEGKIFLTGPVSGLAGIFLGPFYYYLIAPFYLIGGGDPRLPAVFLSFLTVLALPFLFYMASKIVNRTAGFISVLVGGFSYYLVLSGRWLANPTPMFLTSVLLLLSMWKISASTNSKRNFQQEINTLWIVISVLIGISLQFESASAVFYIPMTVVFALWQRKRLPQKKAFVIAVAIFMATLLPQILFNFRHGNLIADSFKRVLVEENSFRNPLTVENLVIKRDFLWNVFDSKIYPVKTNSSVLVYIAFLVGLSLLFSKKRDILILFAIFLGVPALGYIFFQGNEGHIYDYYLTGYYLPLVLLFSIGLGILWKFIIGKVIITGFLIFFLARNGILIKDYLDSPLGGPGQIGLGTELAAVDWIYGNSRGRGEFNVDIYVPPVIPHSYDYLFLWRGTKFCGENLCGLVKDKNVPLLYTLYEDDVPHADRLYNWLQRQKGIGRVEEGIRFGGITVERRTRL